MAATNGLASMVDKSKFTMCENLATSERAVVSSGKLLELIQYAPQTGKAHRRAVSTVPSQSDKSYIWDKSPGRSVVEYLFALGNEVFIASWRSPRQDHAGWGLGDDVIALARGADLACGTSGSNDLNVAGACSGGLTASLLRGHWTASGMARANRYTRLAANLDVAGAGDTAMRLFTNFQTLELTRMFPKSRCILPGKDLQRAYAWLRPKHLSGPTRSPTP